MSVLAFFGTFGLIQVSKSKGSSGNLPIHVESFPLEPHEKKSNLWPREIPDSIAINQNYPFLDSPFPTKSSTRSLKLSIETLT